MFRISGVSSTTSISLSLYHLNLYTFPSLHMSSIYLKTSSFYLFYHTKYVSCCHSLNLFLKFGNYFSSSTISTISSSVQPSAVQIFISTSEFTETPSFFIFASVAGLTFASAASSLLFISLSISNLNNFL